MRRIAVDVFIQIILQFSMRDLSIVRTTRFNVIIAYAESEIGINREFVNLNR